MNPMPRPDEVQLFYHPKDQLRMTVRDEFSWVAVEPKWAAPLSHPERFLGILNSKGEEVLMVETLDDFPAETRAIVEEELRRRYLTSAVLRILNAKVEFGATYWTILTARGERDFVVQSLQENAQWIGPRHLLLVDIDGNRFEIKDIDALDPASKKFIESIL